MGTVLGAAVIVPMCDVRALGAILPSRDPVDDIDPIWNEMHLIANHSIAQDARARNARS